MRKITINRDYHKPLEPSEMTSYWLSLTLDIRSSSFAKYSTVRKSNMDPRDFHLLALYEFKLGHEAADAARSLQRIFGETAPQEKTVREWFTRFLAGDDKPEDAKRTSRSSSPGSIPVRLDDFVKKLMEPQPGKSWSDVVKEVGSMYNNTDFYADGMKALVSRWEKCIEHNGAYI
ncbi:hypothetical protein NECAME_15131 [Necator americanus]|uniref:Mos1 transposase HTH domain-containing protein n=1 Tax=Necator americanus TaxID=51031 RepID=W2SJH5_NECAM|nr:hypothetical protein NECAME_15131 [Necator americanus]ETN69745.1 hypothetical protein NECAME_15131 [Necator americanus]